MYQTEVAGEHHKFGTSGFLYRSSKLMYDQQTVSLWSTLQGEPVVGPLVGKGIRLKRRHVVTTTWGEWRGRHPETVVLSNDTGHVRDYGEGVAYRDYFATDELKYLIPKTDDRLRNKAPVLIVGEGFDRVAITTEFLTHHPVYHDTIGDTNVVVLTSNMAAHRAYIADNVRFQTWDDDSRAVDSEGNSWTVTEAALKQGDRELKRAPAHRAFWFGWQAQFPDTRLVH